MQQNIAKSRISDPDNAHLEGGHFGELTWADERFSMPTLITGYIQKRIDQGAFVKINAEIVARLFVETVFMYIADQTAVITGPTLPFSDDEVVETWLTSS